LLDLLLFLLDFVDEDAELHQVVGLRDGRRVGFFVGLEGNKPMLVGCNESVGDIVGFKVGRILGLKVGASVGLADGLNVGAGMSML